MATAGDKSATFNGTTWSAPISTTTAQTPLIDCPADNLCYGVAGNQWVTFNGTAWSAPLTIGTGSDVFSALSCPSTTFCLATGEPIFNALGGSPGGEDYATFNGTTWTGAAVGRLGRLGVERVLRLVDLLRRHRAGRHHASAGTAAVWTDPVLLDAPTVSDLGPDISCPAVGTCIVSGEDGAFVGTA